MQLNWRAIREFAQKHAWTRFAGSVILLGAALLLLPRHRLATALTHLDAVLMLASLPAFLAIHTLSGWKWLLLANRSGAGIGRLRALESYFAGIFGTLFLPTLGGDAVSIALGSRYAKKPVGIVEGAVLSRGLDTVALAVLVGLAAVSVPDALAESEARPLLALLGAVGTVAVAGAALLYVFRPEFRRPRAIAVPLVISMTVQTAFALMALVIARSCRISIAFGPWMFAWLLAKLVTFVPLTIAGIGARELALAALLAPFGVPAEQAVTLGVAWDVVAVAGGAGAGVVAKVLARAAVRSEPVKVTT